jgi:hypothetical protein
MGKYGGHMGKSLELSFRTYGKIWRIYGKKGEPIYDLGHMGISQELNSGKIMADIWELPSKILFLQFLTCNS